MPKHHVLANADAVGLNYPKKWKDSPGLGTSEVTIQPHRRYSISHVSLVHRTENHSLLRL